MNSVCLLSHAIGHIYMNTVFSQRVEHTWPSNVAKKPEKSSTRAREEAELRGRVLNGEKPERKMLYNYSYLKEQGTEKNIPAGLPWPVVSQLPFVHVLKNLKHVHGNNPENKVLYIFFFQVEVS